MIELKRQVGRREALRIAMLGALAILAGCEEKASHWGAYHRKDPNRQRMLAKLKKGYKALSPTN